MSTRTVPGNPDASDRAGGERRRGVAAIAGGAALVVIALGATACTAAPSGNSSPVSLNGPSRPAGLVTSSSAPVAPVAVTSSSTAPGDPVAAGSPAVASMTPGSAARGGTHSRTTAAPTTSASRSAPPGSAASATTPNGSAPSDPGAGSAPSSSAPPSSAPPSSAPSTEPASSEPAGGGALSVSRDCADQTTVSKLDPYSCTLTASGGTPFYSWVVFVNGAMDYGYSSPSGLTWRIGGTNFSVQTISGKPESQGTYAFTVTVQDQEPGNPPVTASTSFTLTVQ